MIKVPVSEYPQNRTWDEKAFRAPDLPRGNKGVLTNLKTILTKVQDGEPSHQVVSFDGCDSKLTLDMLCLTLASPPLFVRVQSRWTLTEAAARYLESDDKLYLAAFLCANVKFMAEILFFLADVPRKAAELHDIGAREYNLPWKTRQSLHVRLVWLKEFGFIHYQTPSHLYSLTDTGRAFLKNVAVTDSKNIGIGADATAHETRPPASNWVLAYCAAEQENLPFRKMVIGEVPGNINDFVETLAEYLALIGSGSNMDTLVSYGGDKYDTPKQAMNSFIRTLDQLGFIKQKGKSITMTPIANQWLESKSIVEMVCCLHAKFLFVLEMLKELEDKSHTRKELAAIAKDAYGFNWANVRQIERRIRIFKAAKLIRNTLGGQNRRLNRYTLTQRGKRLLKLVPLQAPKNSESRTTSPNPYDFLFTELRTLSKMPSDLARLRRSVETAFQALSFATALRGLDLLIHASGTPECSFSAMIYPKAGTNVDFVKLNERRKKLGADFLIITGYSFYRSMVDRATSQGAMLLTTDSLEKLIRQHMDAPVSTAAYRKIFEKPGMADIGLVDQNRIEIGRVGLLMKSVMKFLLTEKKNGKIGGSFTASEVFLAVRSTHKFGEMSKVEHVAQMLDFLASPIMGFAEKTRGGYRATMSLSDAADKLAFYAKSCNK